MVPHPYTILQQKFVFVFLQLLFGSESKGLQGLLVSMYAYSFLISCIVFSFVL